MKNGYCINNCSCPCPTLLESGVCTDKGMKALKRKESEKVKRQAKADFEQYCRDMEIDLSNIKELLKVKPLKDTKKMVKSYRPLRHYKQMIELSL